MFQIQLINAVVEWEWKLKYEGRSSTRRQQAKTHILFGGLFVDL